MGQGSRRSLKALRDPRPCLESHHIPLPAKALALLLMLFLLPGVPSLFFLPTFAHPTRCGWNGNSTRMYSSPALGVDGHFLLWVTSALGTST